MKHENFKKKDRCLVWAHRGASGYAPENTMFSFQKAIELGADGIELDVQLTKDGKLVVIHDEKIDRTSNGKGFVRDYTLKELRKYNYNATYPKVKNAEIPLLEDVYELFASKDMTINVELKTGVFFYPEIEEKLLFLTKQYKMEDRVLYSSFNHYTCKKIHQLNPNAYVGFLCADGMINTASYAKSNGANALHPSRHSLQYPNYMQDANSNGLDVNVWTVNTKDQLEDACRQGVNALITNYPDKALTISKALGI